jgi:hypothetical protein
VASPGKVSKTLSQNQNQNTNTERAGHVVQVIECLSNMCEAQYHKNKTKTQNQTPKQSCHLK